MSNIYYQQNKEKCQEYARKQYQKNRSQKLIQAKIYRQENSEKHKLAKKKCREAFRLRMRKIVDDYKSSLGCKVCGEKDPVVLDFHHRNPLEKDDLIRQLISSYYSEDVIMTEIAKCDVLCSNDHRRLHHRLRKEE